MNFKLIRVTAFSAHEKHIYNVDLMFVAACSTFEDFHFLVVTEHYPDRVI